MSQLLTQCPFCQTTFRVSEPQLQAASGVVRCGSCMEVFLATQHRVILKERPARPQNSEPDISADFPATPAHTETAEYPGPDAVSGPSWQAIEDDMAAAQEDDTADMDSSHDTGVSWHDAFDEDSSDTSADWQESASDDEDDDWLEDEEPLVADQDDEFDEEHFEDDSDDDALGLDDSSADPDPDMPPELEETSDHDLFSSWEAEEAFRGRKSADHAAADEGKSPDAYTSTSAEDIAFDDDEEFAEPDAPASEAESAGADTPAPAAGEKADFSGRLNPAGYAIAGFSVDLVLPEKSAIDEALENDASWWDAPPDSEDITHAGSTEHSASEDEPWEDEKWEDEPWEDAPAPDTGTGEDGPEAPPASAAATGQPGPVKTPVIVPEKSSEIPTLVPDLVASEEIPPQSLGAQTMAWFQSIRRTFRDSREDDRSAASYAGSDEKAAIRSHLVGLRDEDSLELVDSDALEHLDDAPVELPVSRPRFTALQQTAFVAAAVVLLAALAFQYTWFQLDRLVLERRLPAITGLLCRMTTCPDPQVIDLTSLVTEELIVRSHPTVADALQVDFIFRNDRNREQRFPLVELNFTNNDGDIVANRVFTSEEYMPGEMQLFTHMPAHSSIQVSLELVDPGLEATGYSLVFRNP